MSEIINHKSDGKALSKDDGFYLDCYGKQQPRMTTSGWKLLVEWKDGNSSWVSLNDMKDSYPLKTAEYSVMKKISTEPAFALWVPHVLQKWSWIINKVKSKYWKRTHKYGMLGLGLGLGSCVMRDGNCEGNCDGNCQGNCEGNCYWVTGIG